MIGTVLSNRYKLMAELGSGGMAWVYLAEDLVERQKVAVKVLYPQHSQDLGFLHRFIREAKLSMTLSQSSPQGNIVRVLDYGADRDTHYLVMEYVQGQDLGHLLEKEGPLSCQEALELGRQVAVALDHAHQLDIVHRDIKPSNIMVRPDGTVRVLDFGIARARSSPHLTVTGFVGSPHYAAPEQATGDQVDIRADIYSLGIVLYQMLSGSPPFQGDTPWAIVNQHVAADPPPLAEIRPDLPSPVIHLVQKAMAKRPADRFQTPVDTVKAIDAVLAGKELPFEPAPTKPDPAPALEALYVRAQEAVEAEAWQEAVDLFSQILKVDPDFRDVTEQLGEVGQQIRLSNLYRATHRALQSGQWDRALTQLDRIAQVDPHYKDIEDLRLKAENRERPPSEPGPLAFDSPTQIPNGPSQDAPASPRLTRSAQTPGLTSPPASPTSPRRKWLWAGLPALAILLALVLYLALAQPQPDSSAIANTQPSPTPTVQNTAVADTAIPAAAPTATSPRPSPTNTSPLATSTATDTPPPADTPTPTRTAGPTRTPSPTPTSTLTPSPTPSPTRFVAVRRSPTGQIAFPRFDPARRTYDVYICRVDGSSCRAVAAEASQPDLMPDGKAVVVHSWKADAKGLVVLALSGERIWQITGQIESARPSVDPQGKTFVYHSRGESDRQPRLFRTYNGDTRPISREASTVVGLSPAWLPNGEVLYSGCWQNACGILAMRADGTFPRQVVPGTAETNPEASPDGKQLAFMSQRDGNWEVYVANVDGSNLRRLTQNPANDGLPTWSPDGRYIAFVTDRDGPWAIWVMRADGGEQRRLFGIGGPLDGQVRDAATHESHGWVEERISWAP